MRSPILNIFFDTISVILNLLPRCFLKSVCRLIGFFWFEILRYRRNDVLGNLRSAYGEEKTEQEIRELARRNFDHYVYSLCELVQLRTLSADELKKRIKFENAECLRELTDQDRGVVILTMHLGNFEWMGALASHLGIPLSIVARVMKNRLMESVISHQRKRWGIRVIQPLKNTLLSMLRELRRNRVIGFMIDQRRGPPEGIFVDFFGRPAATTPGLAYLAEKTDAKVFPFYNYRTDLGEFVAKLGPAIPYKRIGRRDENVYHNTQRYTEVIENMIREYPEQWFWIHRRWR